MSGLVVTGYASLDHVIVLGAEIQYGRTTTITSRSAQAWPRLGGGPAYVAAAVSKRYTGPVAPISWVGNDTLGESYISQLAEHRISAAGMAKLDHARSPVAMLVYNPAGDCACLYDPGTAGDIHLTEDQKTLIEASDCVCVTIGPKGVTHELLALVRDDQMLTWVVKDDPKALTPEQAARLAGRADLIFCNGRERAFLENAVAGNGNRRAGQWIVETQGQRGAVFEHDGTREFVPAEPMTVRDPTGAGDSFAGGVLAAFLNGERDPLVLGRSGHEAARALLLTRKSEEESEQG